MKLLSVIIPTRNRAKSLGRALEVITRQSFPQEKFEVIVVDNGSTDNTREISCCYRKKIKNLVYLYEKKPGLHVGRHLGLNASTTDILVYTDDDVEPFPEWLETINSIFKSNNEVVLAGGKNLPLFESTPPQWLLKLWEKKTGDGQILDYFSLIDLGDEVKQVNPYYIFGCNFSIRKKVLLQAGGFHPDGMPEELAFFRGDGESHVSRFIMDKGLKALYHPRASLHHAISNDKMTIDYVMRQAYKHGISRSYSSVRDNNVMRNKITCIKKSILFHFTPTMHGKIQRSYVKGFNDHQKALKKNSDIYDWVTKKNYF